MYFIHNIAEIVIQYLMGTTFKKKMLDLVAILMFSLVILTIYTAFVYQDEIATGVLSDKEQKEIEKNNDVVNGTSTKNFNINDIMSYIIENSKFDRLMIYDIEKTNKNLNTYIKQEDHYISNEENNRFLNNIPIEYDDTINSISNNKCVTIERGKLSSKDLFKDHMDDIGIGLILRCPLKKDGNIIGFIQVDYIGDAKDINKQEIEKIKGKFDLLQGVYIDRLEQED